MTTTVSFDPQVYKALKHLAVEQGRTVRDIIREIVYQHLRAQQKKGHA